MHGTMVSVITGCPTILVDYTNWKGERALRTIKPLRAYYGSNQWHPAMQWLLEVFDVEKDAKRVFNFEGLGWPAPGAPEKEGSD